MTEEFAEIQAKKIVTVTLTLRQIENYLRKTGWRQEVTGKWRSKYGHEILNCCSLQQAVDQIAFVERRDSYSLVKDITC